MSHGKFKLVGMDPSLRNWGIAVATFDIETGKLMINRVQTICPLLPTGKQVRQNSVDIEASSQLYEGAIAAAEGAHAVFCEPPVGSQSARAMASYGICMGVLGALRKSGVAFHEVTANEVKLAGPGNKQASKREMITWAMAKHPEANWPTYVEHGKVLVSETKAEHMADAVASIYAGIASNSFKQVLPFLTQKASHAN